MSTPAPKRRWFRFGLRTLLVVVTVACLLSGWVVYQLDWIRQRNEVITRGDWGADPTLPDVPFHLRGKWDYPPWTLGLFGETGIGVQCLSFAPDTPDDELQRIQRLFPETTVKRIGE